MFDPTAFDNVKVVLEGALYDLDIIGELCVIDRNDLVNIAKLSRQLEMTVKKDKVSKSSCKIVLRSDITNLAAELHPKLQSEIEAGCHFKMIYCMNEPASTYERPLKILQSIWGMEREYICKVIHHPLQAGEGNQLEIEVIFNRLIYEDQMEDLTVLANYILQSVEQLDEGLEY